MMPYVVGFWILAVISVGSAIGVVVARSPIRAALLLVVNFVMLALMYVLLNAQLLAALQILVYAGAIMVLFLFVIQLLNLGGETTRTDPLVGQRTVGLVLALVLLGGLIYGLNDYHLPPAQNAGAQRIFALQAQNVSQIQVIGWDLFTRYVYPFELTSVLLLVGVIGVMIFTKQRALPGGSDAHKS